MEFSEKEFMRLEYAFGLPLNIHVPREENWTARSMGLEGGGSYLRLEGREAPKQSWQESLSFSLAGANCDSPLAKMSLTPESILVVDTPPSYCRHSNCLPITMHTSRSQPTSP